MVRLLLCRTYAAATQQAASRIIMYQCVGYLCYILHTLYYTYTSMIRNFVYMEIKELVLLFPIVISSNLALDMND